MIRRTLLQQGLASFVGGSVLHAAAKNQVQSIGERMIPNVSVNNQDGKQFHLYDDLVKGKIVMINFMYAQCEGVCPTMTSTLVRVQKALGKRVGSDIFMYSITLKPMEDDSNALRHYVQMHGVGPGWQFLRASQKDTDKLRKSLGFVDSQPEIEADVTQHTGMVRIGNDAIDRWNACPAILPVARLVSAVLSMDPANDTKRV